MTIVKSITVNYSGVRFWTSGIGALGVRLSQPGVTHQSSSYRTRYSTLNAGLKESWHSKHKSRNPRWWSLLLTIPPSWECIPPTPYHAPFVTCCVFFRLPLTHRTCTLATGKIALLFTNNKMGGPREVATKEVPGGAMFHTWQCFPECMPQWPSTPKRRRQSTHLVLASDKRSWHDSW